MGAALGRSATRASFDVAPVLRSRNIGFIRGITRRVDTANRSVEVDGATFNYDALIIATGTRPNPNAVPGGAGEFSHNHYILGQESSQDVRDRLIRLIREPGPVVVGALPGAWYLSAMYELILGIDRLLRDEGVRERAGLTFVTPEPYLGHLGFGQIAARPRLERLFADRGIAFQTGAEIVRVGRDEVFLGGGESLPSTASFLLPPFTGDVDLWKSAGLTDELGFIPIDPWYRHVATESVYAAGDAARFQRPIPPLFDLERPHTGYLSMRMGATAAENVTAALTGSTPPTQTLPGLLDVRVIEGPDSGFLLASRGREQLRHWALPLPGRLSGRLKVASERFVVARLKSGRVGPV